MHLELIKNHHGLIVQLLLAIVRSRYACIGRELGPVDQSGNPRPDSEQSKDSKQKEVQNLDIAVHSCTYLRFKKEQGTNRLNVENENSCQATPGVAEAHRRSPK